MDFLSQIGLLVAVTEGLGPWGWLKYGFTQLVEIFFNFTMMLGIPSYALAIFFFTIIIKLVMQPLMNKQMRSTRQMGRLQPQLQEIQKKYAGNQQKQQQETMKLYKEMGVSPMAGCLPLLIQMPILIALFQALREFPPMHPEFYGFLWIAPPVWDVISQTWSGGLGAPDPTGWILPVITGAASFFQQYLTITNKSDKTQKMMLYTMPIMFGWFARSFPAFLALYWTYYSVIGGLIQFALNKRWAKQDAILDAERAAKEEEERLQKKAKKAEQKGQAFVEEEEKSEKPDNIVEVDGVEYILPPGYSLREKKVRAHPYSTEEETITVAVLPDGHERPVTALKRNAPPLPAMPSMPSFNFGGFGKKKKEGNK